MGVEPFKRFLCHSFGLLRLRHRLQLHQRFTLARYHHVLALKGAVYQFGQPVLGFGNAVCAHHANSDWWAKLSRLGPHRMGDRVLDYRFSRGARPFVLRTGGACGGCSGSTRTAGSGALTPNTSRTAGSAASAIAAWPSAVG